MVDAFPHGETAPLQNMHMAFQISPELLRESLHHLLCKTGLEVAQPVTGSLQTGLLLVDIALPVTSVSDANSLGTDVIVGDIHSLKNEREISVNNTFQQLCPLHININ